MKYLRSFPPVVVFAVVVLAVAPVSAQFSSKVWTKSLFGSQGPAESGPLAGPVGQKLHISFAPAVAYASGSPFAISIAVADLNGDGIPDLVMANYCENESCENGGVSVLLGNGDGTFQPAVTYSTGAADGYSVAVADLNGDHIPDLVVANYCQSLNQNGYCIGDGEVTVLIGNGDGTFQPAVNYDSGGFLANSVALGDLNGDGKLDVAVTNQGKDGGNIGSVSVLMGNGDGTFQPAVNYSTVGWNAVWVAIGDLSGNGIPDLVVANFCQGYGCDIYAGEVAVLPGNGDGTFQPAVLYDSGGELAYSVAVSDLRGDGILDTVVSNKFSDNTEGNTHNAVDVLLGNGDGTFQPAVSYLLPGADVDSVAVGDVNGDGIPDLVVVEKCERLYPLTGCYGTGEVSILLGNGDGTFQSPVRYGSGGYGAVSVAVADVNGDGRPDLVLANDCGASVSCTEGSAAVLLNETHYASKTALASSPNPSQINQTVTFTATITSTPAVPNGELVTFYNGKTEIGTGTTTNTVATLTTSFSAAKTYTIKATYPGDPFRKASSGTVKQVVNP